jgi:hypothetical protein
MSFVVKPERGHDIELPREGDCDVTHIWIKEGLFCVGDKSICYTYIVTKGVLCENYIEYLEQVSTNKEPKRKEIALHILAERELLDAHKGQNETH